ncbi:MAG TPA: lysylphosphatidylglycerol synthase domain-containing protein [Rhodanobacteraceae bacterium]|nr:lysylphosphatidylglycerol synthase domain-containing protein [Rhodanobacteraceae bacterium]
MSIGRTWRSALHPRVVLPVLLAAALFMVAISLGDLGQVVGRIKAVSVGSMALVLGFAALYLVLKALQLHLLLNDLGAHPGWRRFMLAFAVGELALTFPLGIFAQNWVLAGKKDMHFGRSSAATVVMLVTEVVVALLWLAVNGMPGWGPVRPVTVGILGGMVIFGFALLRFRLLDRLAARMAHHRVHRVLDEGLGLLHGLEKLGKWRIFGTNLLVTAAYLGALGAAFWVMGQGMGLQELSYREAATIYAFALASVLVSGGLFGQIGTVEVIGMSAATAWGLDYTGGLALMLGFRLAWTGSMWLLNGVIALTLWRKVRLSVDGSEKTGH